MTGTDNPHSDSLEVNHSMLHFDEERKILICKHCRRAINANWKSVRQHFQSQHGEQLPPKPQLVSQRIQDEAIKSSNDSGIEAVQALGFCPWLDVKDGYRCMASPDCNYVCPMDSTMRNHLQSKHGAFKADFDSLSSYPVTISSVFGTVRQIYFEVSVPPADTRIEEHPDQDRRLSIIQRAFAELSRKQSNAISTAPDQPAQEDIGLWHTYTGWPQRFAGEDMTALSKMANAKQGGGEQYLYDLGIYVKSWILVMSSQLTEFPSSYRQVFNSLTPSERNYNPLKSIIPETMAKYSNIWVSFFVFLLRIHQQEDKLGIINDSNLWAGVAELYDALIDDATAVPTRASEELEQSRSLPAWNALNRIMHFTLHQSIMYDKWASPLFLFTGVLGYSRRTHTWRSATDYRPDLSAIIYIARLFSINEFMRRLPGSPDRPLSENTLPNDEENTSSDIALEAAVNHARNTVSHGTPTVFDAVHTLRTHAKTIGKQFYVAPSVHWELGHETLIAEGAKIPLPRIASMMKTLITDLEVLVTQLAFRDNAGKADYLDTRDPTLFTDDFMLADRYANFINIRHNDKLRGGFVRVFQWAEQVPADERPKFWPLTSREDAVDPSDAAGEGQILAVVNRGRFQVYRQMVDSFLRKLIVAVHMTSGIPGRGTEICSLKSSNSMQSRRNFYVYQNHVLAISAYNKTDSAHQKPKVISRALPTSLSRVMIAFLADVKPFHDNIANMLDDENDPVPTAEIFTTSKGKINSSLMADLIASTTKEHLGTPIKILGWRDMAIAIEQEHIRGATAVMENNEHLVNTIMAGHSRETEDHHYAITAGDITGINGRTLRAMTLISRLWHALFKIGGEADPKLNDHITPWVADAYKSMSAVRAAANTTVTSADGDGDGEASTAPALVRSTWSRKKRLVQDPREEQASVMDTFSHDRILESFRVLYGSNANFRPGQYEAIRAVLAEEKDCCVVLPTGSGKTALITVPALMRPGLVTIVVVPFISLRNDLRRELKQSGCQAVEFDPNLPPSSGGVIFVTPEAARSDSFRTHFTNLVSKSRVRNVVLDEAHIYATDNSWRASLEDMGWLRAYSKQPVHCRSNGRPLPIVFMSGSLPAHVQKSLLRSFDIDAKALVECRERCTRTNISFRFAEVPHQSQGPVVKLIAEQQHERAAKTVVYVKTFNDVKRVCEMLSHLTVRPYYSGLSLEERNATVDKFNAGECLIIVATPALGVGVNLKGLGCVLFAFGGAYGMVECVQQAGRAARGSGEFGCAIYLFSHEDIATAVAKGSDLTVNEAALLNMLTARTCRLMTMGTYLDGRADTTCSSPAAACDFCAELRFPTQQLTAMQPPALTEFIGGRIPECLRYESVRPLYSSSSIVPETVISDSDLPSGRRGLPQTIPPTANPLSMSSSSAGKVFHSTPPAMPTPTPRVRPHASSSGNTRAMTYDPAGSSSPAPANARPLPVPRTPHFAGDPAKAYGSAGSQPPRRSDQPFPYPPARPAGHETRALPSSVGGSPRINKSQMTKTNMRSLIESAGLHHGCIKCKLHADRDEPPLGADAHTASNCTEHPWPDANFVTGLLKHTRNLDWMSNVPGWICFRCQLPYHVHDDEWSPRKECPFRARDLMGWIMAHGLFSKDRRYHDIFAQFDIITPIDTYTTAESAVKDMKELFVPQLGADDGLGSFGIFSLLEGLLWTHLHNNK